MTAHSEAQPGAHSAEPLVRTFGRYSLYAPIGSGGMATVHLARLAGAAGFTRTVAIKRMHPHLARDPQFVGMFTDEAKLAARIQHPNVVQTLDVVSFQDELFVVLEYVHGVSLSQLIRQARANDGGIPVGVALRVGVDVLHGLHAAHEARSERGEPLELVHRDVSPQNVIVGTDGTARVLDFGVAKALGRMQASTEGQIKGKVAYVSPEQLRGERVSRTSDIYSAGVMLWEVLAGRQLFQGATEATVLMAILEGKIPSLRSYCPDVPPLLEAALGRALSSNPSIRFATAAEMADALERAAPMASAREVGAWAEIVATKSLEKRAALLARVESSPCNVSVANVVELELTPSGGHPLLPEAPITFTDRKSMSVATSITKSFAPPRSRKAVVWAVLGVLAGAGVLALVALLGGGEPASRETAQAAPPTPPPSAEPAPAPPPAPSAAATETAPAPSASSTAVAAVTAKPASGKPGPAAAKPGKSEPTKKPGTTSPAAPSGERIEDLFGRN
jgi:serine/threonine-protein kinase